MQETVSLNESGNVAGASYDLDTMTLLVTFKSGATYSYSPVPQNVVTDWTQAISTGQYFSQNIRNNPNYTCSKVP